MDNNSYYPTIKMPETCGQCKGCAGYTSGPFSRNPHSCCELYWWLYHEEIRVRTDSRWEDCPLQFFSFVDKEGKE